MKTQLLTPADYRAMPWKNGLGLTREIAAGRSADDDAAGGFAWRLSIAEVTASAPFSAFPGVDRTIVLLHGDGMVLDSGDAGCHVLNRPFAPYSFKGEWQTDCRLIGGPCRDFNVMTDRSRAHALVQVISVTAQQPQHESATGKTLALFALSGTLQVVIESQQTFYEVPAQHTLLLSTSSEIPATRHLILQTSEELANALLIDISFVG